MVFNLDSSVSNDELRQIFGVYGEIKEVRLGAKLRVGLIFCFRQNFANSVLWTADS